MWRPDRIKGISFIWPAAANTAVTGLIGEDVTTEEKMKDVLPLCIPLFGSYFSFSQTLHVPSFYSEHIPHKRSSFWEQE